MSRAYYATYQCYARCWSRAGSNRGRTRALSGLQRQRELADYDAAVTFSADDVRAEIDAVRAFDAAARALLGAEGWLTPAPGG